jgi:lipoprotein-anchoring transpeptidase ErfK/SrfK
VKRPLVLAVLAALLAPAAAAAQQPAPAPAPPAPAPAPAKITLAAAKVKSAGKSKLTLRKRSWLVQGAIAPAAANERIQLLIHRDGEQIRKATVVTAADGSFARRMKTRRAGRYSVRAVHPGSAVIAATTGPKVTVSVFAPRAVDGDRNALVKLLQRSLARLHYAVPTGGSYDVATGRAVMAFRKVNSMPRRYDADRAVIEKAIALKGGFKVRHPDAGRHVEADLSRQVLALIVGDEVVATYHTSSGAAATPTVIGSFRVYMQTPGYNAKGMLDSSYFIRGYAIHGYVDVPAFNASHGCLRIPIPDAARVFSWLHIGDRVIVYP